MAIAASAPLSANSTGPTTFWPNMLDQYDQCTYNLKLYMVSEKAAIEKNVFDLSEQRVIAQSGVTADVEIDGLSFTSVQGLTQETHTGTSLKFSFTLRQALGADLLDRIYDFADTLGVANYTKIPFYLELSFRGRAEATSLDSTSLQSLVWLWPILITKMGIEINSGGSTYDCEAVAYSDLAYSNEFGNIDKSMGIPVTTVDDYFTKIAPLISKRQKDEAANNISIPDEWEFWFDKDIGQAKVVADNQDENSSRYATFSKAGAPNQTIVQFNDGTDILRAIDAVIANTDYQQKKGKNTATADADATESDIQADKMFKKLYKVYTNTQVLAFDEKRGEYARKFSYYVKAYDIGTIVSEPPPKDTNGDMSKAKAKKLISEGYIRKRYDYMFTGLNDQVFDFNLNFDMAWYATKAVQAGYEITDASVSQNAAVLPQRSQQDIKESREKTSKQSGLTPSGTIAKKGAFHTKGALGITSRPGDDALSNVFGVEGKLGKGRNELSTLFNQVTSSDMLTLEIDIKGDPYWIEPLPYSRSARDFKKYAESIVAETNRRVENMVYTKQGQIYMLFYSRFPNIDVMSGEPRAGFTNNQVINGIYHVIKVECTFDKGKFTQKLFCVREKTIDVSKTDLLYKFK